MHKGEVRTLALGRGGGVGFEPNVLEGLDPMLTVWFCSSCNARVTWQTEKDRTLVQSPVMDVTP